MDRALRIGPYVFHEVSDRFGLSRQAAKGSQGEARGSGLAVVGLSHRALDFGITGGYCRRIRHLAGRRVDVRKADARKAERMKSCHLLQLLATAAAFSVSCVHQTWVC